MDIADKGEQIVVNSERHPLGKQVALNPILADKGAVGAAFIDKVELTTRSDDRGMVS